MKNLIIPPDQREKFKPEVNFNAETGICEISGESFMEAPDMFYIPLINWLEEYISLINKKIQLNIKLTYYNTNSSKFILQLLRLLSDYSNKDGEVEVNWHYSIEDEDMSEEIEEFSKESGLDIKGIRH